MKSHLKAAAVALTAALSVTLPNSASAMCGGGCGGTPGSCGGAGSCGSAVPSVDKYKDIVSSDGWYAAGSLYKILADTQLSISRSLVTNPTSSTLSALIAHEKSAIEIAKVVTKQIEDPAVRDAMAKLIEKRTADIGELSTLLANADAKK